MATKGDLKIDSRAFNKALESMLKQSKREQKTVVEEQARGVIRNVIKVTPPAKSAGESLGSAFRIGKRKVAGDILKVIQGVPVKQAETKSESDISNEHRKARSGGQIKNGRGKSGKLRVPKTQLNAYIRKQQAKVGRLAKGWHPAAQKLGVNVPAWVARHTTSGAYKVKVRTNGIRIRMTNKSPYAGKVGTLQKQVQHAVNIQGKNMRLRVAKANHVAAKRAGFKVGKGL